MDLTKRQQEIFDFIKRYSAKHGYPPTVRDIGKAVGLASSSTVHAHLANLEKLGLLRRDPTKPRAIELLDRARGRPVALGRPACGPAARRLRRRRSADPRRGEHRGVRRRPGRRRRRGRRVRAARARRVDDRRRDPRGRLRRRPPAGRRGRRRDRRRARRARRRPSSASSTRPTTCACSRRTRPWSRSARRTCASSGGSSACSGACHDHHLDLRHRTAIAARCRPPARRDARGRHLGSLGGPRCARRRVLPGLPRRDGAAVRLGRHGGGWPLPHLQDDAELRSVRTTLRRRRRAGRPAPGASALRNLYGAAPP